MDNIDIKWLGTPVGKVLQTISEEDYYDGIEEDIQHEINWAELKANLGTLPETGQETIRRWTDLEALQKHYAYFGDFLHDVMTELMGFQCTDIQIDIGHTLQYGPKYLMIQAQRSQAKSTIVAIFAVWCLIHNPKTRVLILSAGSDVAMEIANWVIQIIMNWEILACMRPDRQHGDRASAKAFDIHWQLKGVEKSPSIACIGVTANMQGRRSDILIPDDIESSKNGLTETQRQHLIHLSKDFTSICQRGRIIYLGTPQTNDSIYGTLPGRGYKVFVWPGRYPTHAELKNYAGTLAPLILRRIKENPALQIGYGPTKESGAPTDSVMLSDEMLIAKELDQGEAYFQLQYMLNTKLSDLGRFPLNTKNLIVMELHPDKAPGEIVWMPAKDNKIVIQGYDNEPEFYGPFSIDTELYDYEMRYMYVDTAGGGRNNDETVAIQLNFLHGYMFIMSMLVLPGGYSEDIYKALSKFAYQYKPNEIGVEQNHGYGALAQNWRPVLLDYYEEQSSKRHAPQIVDDWVSTQKELRIIDTLEPVMGRHKLIINKSVLDYDVEQVQKKPLDLKQIYTLAHQMNKITIDRGALVHDDRIDSLAGAVRKYIDKLAVSEKLRKEQKASSENMKFMSEWSQEFKNTIKSKMGNMFIKQGRKR